MSEAEAIACLERVLSNALGRTFAVAANSVNGPEPEYYPLLRVRQAWLRTLTQAFADHYEPHIKAGRTAVFGGRPGPGETELSGVPSGIPKWRRWEFLYDVSVVDWTTLPAAFAVNNAVPIVTNTVWAVESELAGDGTKVAEDASKLRIARSANALLIARTTRQTKPDEWLRFLNACLDGVQGHAFVALMPSYARGESDAARWVNGTVEIELYRATPPPALPEFVATIRRPGA